MSINDVKVTPHWLNRYRRALRVPIWQIKKALEQKYGISPSTGYLSQVFRGVIVMDSVLERMLITLFIEETKTEDEKNEPGL